MRQKIVRARHFILDLRKKIRIPAANFFYPREIYSNKRDRISRIGGSPPILSLTLSFDEKLSHRDPVCYRSSTPLLEFLDIPVYRSGRSARHSKTISRVDLRLPYVYVRDERVESVAGEEKSEGDRGRRGEKERREGGSITVSQIETYSSRFAISFSNSNFSLFFFSCFSVSDVGSSQEESRVRERERVLLLVEK